MQKPKLIAYGSLMILIAISFLKDEITPEYLNTPHAAFLAPGQLKGNAISTLGTHGGFWLLSFAYSAAFVLLPYFVIRGLFNPVLAKYTLWLMLGLFLLEYTMVFSNSTLLIAKILPKLNRYFHSPIIVLFLVATFKLSMNKDGSDR